MIVVHLVHAGHFGLRCACLGERMPHSSVFTADWRLVTCRRCRETHVFKRLKIKPIPKTRNVKFKQENLF
jgi:hypothetical protein